MGRKGDVEGRWPLVGNASDNKPNRLLFPCRGVEQSNFGARRLEARENAGTRREELLAAIVWIILRENVYRL